MASKPTGDVEPDARIAPSQAVDAGEKQAKRNKKRASDGLRVVLAGH